MTGALSGAVRRGLAVHQPAPRGPPAGASCKNAIDQGGGGGGGPGDQPFRAREGPRFPLPPFLRCDLCPATCQACLRFWPRLGTRLALRPSVSRAPGCAVAVLACRDALRTPARPMANDLDSLRRELLLGLVFHGAAAVGSLHQAARGGQRRQPTGRAACCRLLASCVLDVSARPARAWCAGLAHRDCCRRWGGFLGTRRDPAGDRSNDPRCVARAGENARRWHSCSRRPSRQRSWRGSSCAILAVPRLPQACSAFGTLGKL